VVTHSFVPVLFLMHEIGLIPVIDNKRLVLLPLIKDQMHEF
jgi:hypothetical protein